MEHIKQAISPYRAQILAAERFLWAHPETGFREQESAAFLAREFENLGYSLTYAKDICGFYTVVDTEKEGPEVLVLAELDAVISPSHPSADKRTGAVHACGHHAQCAALLGLAAILKNPAVRNGLCGKIRLCAVPAEEPLEADFREQLRRDGIISHHSGKREFLARGYFDNVDMALMVHLSTHTAVGRGAVGSLRKRVTIQGVSAHAGGAPQNGKNALYAAVCAINGINALRETLVNGERVHVILTRGGETVGTIPDIAELECYVRGETFDAITAANRKVNAALCGGALTLGCTLNIADSLGLAPLQNDAGLTTVAKEAATQIGLQCALYDGITTGSTDMGDLSCIMPVVHPFIAGAAGETHGSDYQIANAETACITNAIWQAAMLHLLLKDEGARAKQILAAYHPLFPSAAAYLRFVSELAADGARIEYQPDKTVFLH